MVTPRLYTYPVKKIELLDAETGKGLLQKKIQFITIDPIEGKYTMLLTNPEQGYPLPLRNILEIKIASTNTIEFDFMGTMDPSSAGVGGIGLRDKKYILKIKTDEKYTPSLPELLQQLKGLENNTEYWKCELLSFPDKTIEIYSQSPFLADGEQILWQNPKYELVDNKKEILSIEVVTNFRIFQYEYIQHRGSTVLFPFLEDVKVTNEQNTTATSSVGSYSEFSYKVTGIKSIRTNSVVGDSNFYMQGKPLITFEGITDPEMLSTAVMTLKKQYDKFPSTKQQTESIGAELQSAVSNICSRCTNINPADSKFCSACGSSLSLGSILFDNPDYVEPTVVRNPELDKIERYRNLVERIDEYKPGWDKNGVIQYKTEYIAILQRIWGAQVQFIIAFDDLTREGYRLMAIDEGKSGGDSSGGFTGGVNSYYYFQKIKYVAN